VAFNYTVHLEALRCRGSVANDVNEGKMGKSFRYTFEPYLGPKSKHQCPSCNKRGVFVRYMDQETGELIDSRAGRCDREFSCGYWVRPSEVITENYRSTSTIVTKLPPKPVLIHPMEWVTTSMPHIEQTELFVYLANRLGVENARWAAKEFRLGASGKHPGAVVFWQIDQFQRVKAGKIFHYDPETGRRDREFGVKWVHSTVGVNEHSLEQCLFGLHRLDDSIKRVAVVESEKTALIMQIKSRSEVGCLWMATGGKSFQIERLEPLRGRKVIFYPDFDAGDAWDKFQDPSSNWVVTQLANDFVELPNGATDLGDLM